MYCVHLKSTYSIILCTMERISSKMCTKHLIKKKSVEHNYQVLYHKENHSRACAHTHTYTHAHACMHILYSHGCTLPIKVMWSSTTGEMHSCWWMTHMCTHTHTHTHTYTHTRAHAHTHKRAHADTHTHHYKHHDREN